MNNSQDKEDTTASEIWDKPSPEYLGAVSQDKDGYYYQEVKIADIPTDDLNLDIKSIKKLEIVSQDKTSWEDRIKKYFDEKYPNVERWHYDGYIETSIVFISSLLTEKEEEYKKTLNSGKKMYEIGKKEGMEEIVRKIEGMKKDTHGVTEPIKVGDDRVAGIVYHGYNQALQDAIEIIKGK